MFKELFYFAYRIFVKAKTSEPEFRAYMFLTFLLYLNAMSLIVIVNHILKVNLIKDFNVNSTYEGLLIGILIIIVLYFTLYSKRKSIIEKYKAQYNNTRSKKDLLFMSYIIGTIICVLYVLSNFVTFS
jgi:uncharacterized membrane protein